MHSYYANRSQSVNNSNYTIMVAEVASTVNEIILAENILKKEKDVEKRKNIISELIGTITSTLVRQSMFAEFERKIHDRIFMEVPTVYTDVTKEYLIKKMKEDKTVVTITSGTPGAVGFNKKDRDEVGSQFVDVGIAEETAVAIASGMASKGAKPVYTVVSTFLQRTYDQLSQDLCINNNPVTIVVYYAGAIGMTDVTHLGWFDIAMMGNIPNLVYLAPTTKEEHLAMLEWSIEQQEHPVAIRIPGGKMVSSGKKVTKDFSKLNTYEVSQRGKKVAIIGLGTFYKLGEKVAKLYEERIGVKATVINPMYITGVDEKLLEELKKDHSLVITLEDGVLDGGLGEKIARFYGNSDMKVLNYGLKKEFLDRHDIGKLLTKNRLKADLIVEDLLKF